MAREMGERGPPSDADPVAVLKSFSRNRFFVGGPMVVVLWWVRGGSMVPEVASLVVGSDQSNR